MLEKDQLLSVISDEFPIIESSNTFKDLYPFCNELGFAQIIKQIKKITCTDTKALKVSLLFGESNVLSLLPYLAEISDIVLLADVNPEHHRHLGFLLECFNTSTTPEQFRENYLQNTPALNKDVPNLYKLKYDNAELNRILSFSKESVGKYHFLNNQTNFDQCKQSLAKIKLLQVHLDLIDANACSKLNAILTQHNAVFTLCNFTNIHNYVDNNALKQSVSLLLKNNDLALIMFSTGFQKDLRAIYTTDLNRYLTIGTQHYCSSLDDFLKQMQAQKDNLDNYIKHKGLFSKKPKPAKEKPIEVCYLAFSGSKDQVMTILRGEKDMESYSFTLHAQDTPEEAKQFALSIWKFFTLFSDTDEYWIFKIRGNKDKINPWLKYRGEDVTYHNPRDKLVAKANVHARIIEVKNAQGTLSIAKNGEESSPSESALSLNYSEFRF